MEESDATLRESLEVELGEVAWLELRQLYACGSALRVETELDLLDVAVALAKDDTAAVAAWLEKGQIAKVDEDLARQWFDEQVTVTAIVVSPWVLVQESVTSC